MEVTLINTVSGVMIRVPEAKADRLPGFVPLAEAQQAEAEVKAPARRARRVSEKN